MNNPYRIKKNEPTIAEQLAAFPRPLSIAEQVAAMPRPLSIAEQLRAREDWRGNSGVTEGADSQRNRPALMPMTLGKKAKLIPDPTPQENSDGEKHPLQSSKNEYFYQNEGSGVDREYSDIGNEKDIEFLDGKSLKQKYIHVSVKYINIARGPQYGKIIKMNKLDSKIFIEYTIRDALNIKIDRSKSKEIQELQKLWHLRNFDTIFHGKPGVVGKKFYIQGLGIGEAGHLNYVALGMLAARFYGKEAYERVPFLIAAWNFGQNIKNKTARNNEDIGPGAKFARKGIDMFLKRTRGNRR